VTSIYGIQIEFPCGHAGPIKIGITGDVRARLGHLRTACPWPLRLLFDFPGTEKEEAFLHETFAEHRMRGEWFAPHADVVVSCERVAAFAKDLRRRRDRAHAEAVEEILLGPARAR
jgi:hypothetical protein